MPVTFTPFKLSRHDCRKAKTFLVLLLVNSILFLGIYVAASRRIQDRFRTSPFPPSHINLTTQVPAIKNTSENVRLHPVNLYNLPKEIQDVLMKVNSFMESKMIEKSTSICQFAWKLDKAENTVNLFICD